MQPPGSNTAPAGWCGRSATGGQAGGGHEWAQAGQGGGGSRATGCWQEPGRVAAQAPPQPAHLARDAFAVGLQHLCKAQASSGAEFAVEGCREGMRRRQPERMAGRCMATERAQQQPPPPPQPLLQTHLVSIYSAKHGPARGAHEPQQHVDPGPQAAAAVAGAAPACAAGGRGTRLRRGAGACTPGYSSRPAPLTERVRPGG